MRRLAHALGRLRLTAGTCLLIAAALATGSTLLVSGGGDQSRNDHALKDSTERSTAVAGPVPIDAPARAPAVSGPRDRQTTEA